MYNEYQGFSQLEKFLAQLEKEPWLDASTLAAIRKHARDEKKHFLMFQAYFRHEKRRPFSVSKSVGYFDLFVRVVTGNWTWDLDTNQFGRNPNKFAQMCRVIVTTEERGLKQLDSLLGSSLIRRHSRLSKMFSIIRKDEPTHSIPYMHWLVGNGYAVSGPKERAFDWIIHYGIASLVFPALFLNPFLKRVKLDSEKTKANRSRVQRIPERKPTIPNREHSI